MHKGQVCGVLAIAGPLSANSLAKAVIDRPLEGSGGRPRPRSPGCAESELWTVVPQLISTTVLASSSHVSDIPLDAEGEAQNRLSPTK